MCIYNIEKKSVIKCGSVVVRCWVKDAVMDSSDVLDAFRLRMLVSHSLDHYIHNALGASDPINIQLSINSGPKHDDYFVQYYLPMEEVEKLSADGMKSQEIQKLFDEALDEWLL